MLDVAFLPLLQNAALLLGMAVAYDIATTRWTSSSSLEGHRQRGRITHWCHEPGKEHDLESSEHR